MHMRHSILGVFSYLYATFSDMFLRIFPNVRISRLYLYQRIGKPL